MSGGYTISLEQQLSAALEILNSRHMGHPKLIRDGKLTPSQSEFRIAQIEAIVTTLTGIVRSADAQPYQDRVAQWLLVCFGPVVAADPRERNHRFLEEALELVQSCGCTHTEAHQLVDYVFGRQVGDKAQEVGGVMNTLAALCLAHHVSMVQQAEIELARVNTPEAIQKIRAKQAAKPKFSPLPGSAA